MRLHHIVVASLGLLAVAGRAQAAALTPMPASVKFAETGVGAESKASTVTWTNASGAQQTINGLAIAGTNPGDFKLLNIKDQGGNDLQFPSSVPNGFVFTADVSFAPVAGGARAGTLTATMKDGSKIDVALTGTGLGPKLTVTPNPVDAGGSKLNVTKTVTANLSNGGGGSITITSIKIGGPNAVEFVLTKVPGLPLVLGPNGQGAADVQFSYTPTFQGTHNATLIILNNDPNLGPELDVPIQGKAGDPAIASDVGFAAFGNQRVGLTSAPTPVTLSNTGNSDLIITAIGKDGGQNGNGNPGDFVVDTAGINFPVTIPVKQSIMINVSFAPTMVGLRTARVVISSNDPGNPTKYISLQGNGTISMLSIAPPSLDFGDQNIYKGSKAQSIIVSNSGTDAAFISGIVFDGKQCVQGLNCWFRYNGLQQPPIKVPAASNGTPGTAKIDIIALPLGLGAGAGSVTLVTDDPKTPSFGVPLSVNGTGATVSVDPPFGDFGAIPVNGMKTITFTVKNTGTAKLSIATVNLMDANAVFNIGLDNDLQNLPFDLEPGMTKTFSVTFAPMGAAAAFTGEVDLDFEGDPLAAHIHIPLDGSGAQAGLTVAPNTITFPSQLVGAVSAPQNITITNTGSGKLTIKSIALAGTNPNQFNLADSGAAFDLAPGASRMVPVSYQPVSGGTHSASVVVTPDMLAPASVKLSGTAVSPMLTVAVGQDKLDFGDVLVNYPSTPITVGLKVPGSSTIPVAITSIVATNGADFFIDTDTPKTNFNLGPGGTTTFNVIFIPSKKATIQTQININVKGLNAPIQTIAAKGNGYQSTVTTKTDTKPGGGCSMTGRPAAGTALLLFAVQGVVLMLGRRRRRAA